MLLMILVIHLVAMGHFGILQKTVNWCVITVGSCIIGIFQAGQLFGDSMFSGANILLFLIRQGLVLMFFNM